MLLLVEVEVEAVVVVVLTAEVVPQQSRSGQEQE